MAPAETDIAAYLAFFRSAEALKDTLRNSWTATGRRESTAEHSWRLALMAIALEEELPGIDHARLLRMLVLHDLGEALHGDVPAPLQGPDKTAEERADLQSLLAPLPEAAANRLLALWDEYNSLAMPEARIGNGLDRLETVLQHVQGANPPDFDYAFNLGYGRRHSAAHPLIEALRAPVDEETAQLAARATGERDDH